MKFYGYKSNSEEILTLESMAVSCSPLELRELANFMIKCAGEMDSDPDWEHEHFKDRNGLSLGGSESDFIVYSDKLGE